MGIDDANGQDLFNIFVWGILRTLIKYCKFLIKIILG